MQQNMALIHTRPANSETTRGHVRKFASSCLSDDSFAFTASEHNCPLKRFRATQSTPFEPVHDVDATLNHAIQCSTFSLPVANPTPSPDEVLTHMIKQSGAKSHSEVVSFCMSAGIPLSRMLRLDLMRQLSHTMDTD